ncbi:MAG: transposase [Planctomycetota bacterium]|nr:transposase [Planctomycetota bacterium]
MDESGFLLIPTRRRTWGPQGQTPNICYSYRHDRISTLAALSLSAVRPRVGLYVRFQPENFRAVHVPALLAASVGALACTRHSDLSESKIHRGPFIDHVREDFPRLQIQRFPACAPQLNPVEPVWGDFKNHTANSLPQDTQDIRNRLHANTRRVRRSPSRLRAFILASDLPSPLD